MSKETIFTIHIESNVNEELEKVKELKNELKEVKTLIAEITPSITAFEVPNFIPSPKIE